MVLYAFFGKNLESEGGDMVVAYSLVLDDGPLYSSVSRGDVVVMDKHDVRVLGRINLLLLAVKNQFSS
jgi:hypothetical protein